MGMKSNQDQLITHTQTHTVGVRWNEENGTEERRAYPFYDCRCDSGSVGVTTTPLAKYTTI